MENPPGIGKADLGVGGTALGEYRRGVFKVSRNLLSLTKEMKINVSHRWEALTFPYCPIPPRSEADVWRMCNKPGWDAKRFFI
jgi:hypothetical protein